MSVYTALTGDQFVHSDFDLDRLIAFCRGCVDPSRPEDCVIWQGFRVVAVVFSTGAVLTCNTAPVPEPAPADLARLDDTAA